MIFRRLRFAPWVKWLIGLLPLPFVLLQLGINIIQIAHLHDRPPIDLARQLLAIIPSHAHLRGQLAQMLAEAGLHDEALQTLTAQGGPITGDLAAQRLLAVELAYLNQGEKALQQLKAVGNVERIPSGVALRILSDHLQKHWPLSVEDRYKLVSSVVGFTNLDGLKRINAQSDFWATAFGRGLHTALATSSAPSSLISPPPPAPDDATRMQHAANQLNVSASDLVLDPSTIDNGQFQRVNPMTGIPLHWSSAYWVGWGTYNPGGFIIQVDPQLQAKGENAIRIDAFAIEHSSQYQAARAGIAYSPIDIAPNQPYLIEVLYQSTSTGSAIHLTQNEQLFFQNDLFLPVAKTWQRVTIIGWNRTAKVATIQPLLRVFGEGTVWFANISVRAIRRADGQPIPPRDTLIDIRSAP